MIIEHEILEQISEEAWPLPRCLAFIAAHKEPWPVLRGLYADGCVELRRGAEVLPGWQAEAIFRSCDAAPGVSVAITARGLERAFP